MTTTRRAFVAAAGASAVLLAGPAQANLQDRDLNGDTVVDAFYDTDLDITWLRNADVSGLMNWATAVAWAEGYSFGGYSDWRLPTTGAFCGEYNCTGSEMGHLWYVELGNSAGGPQTNYGNFYWPDLIPAYWSGTEYSPSPAYAWAFFTSVGYQNTLGKGSAFHAMAVRPGDVAVVPEPAAYAVALAGLAVLAIARRLWLR